jgi:hypothetical protein
MRILAIGVLLFFAFMGGSASPATRQECAGQCQICGNDVVCGSIYENCINNCMRGSSRPAPPPLPDVWGAIAVSPSSLDYGSSWNFKSEKDAAARAMQECQKSTGAKDCKVAVTVADVCVALAMSKPDKIFAIGGPTGAANYASGNATLHCQRAGGKSCAIITSFCADGIRHETKLPESTPAPFGRR